MSASAWARTPKRFQVAGRLQSMLSSTKIATWMSAAMPAKTAPSTRNTSFMCSAFHGDDRTAAKVPSKHARGGLLHLAQRHLGREPIEQVGVEVALEPGPPVDASLVRRRDGVDAEQADRTQD